MATVVVKGLSVLCISTITHLLRVLACKTQFGYVQREYNAVTRDVASPAVKADSGQLTVQTRVYKTTSMTSQLKLLHNASENGRNEISQKSNTTAVGLTTHELQKLAP